MKLVYVNTEKNLFQNAFIYITFYYVKKKIGIAGIGTS